MIKDYSSNINDILDEGQVEGIKLDNLELLKKLFNDSDVNNKLFEDFYKYFSNNFDLDDLYMKCQDLVYNVHLFINEFLIKTYEISDYTEIKDILKDSINNGLDLYGSPNYNEFDKEVIEEYKDYFNGDISI